MGVLRSLKLHIVMFFILHLSLFLTVSLKDKGIGPIWLMAQKGWETLIYMKCTVLSVIVEPTRNVTAHAQKPELVFLRNGRVHFNRRGRQFSQLLAVEECGVWMQDDWLPTPFASFPFTSPPVRLRVPSDPAWAIRCTCWYSTASICWLEFIELF